MKVKAIIIMALTVFPLSAFSNEPGAHVHGIATLQVALDGKLLTLAFSSPLDNLIGFEHKPQTDKQKALVKAMDEKMHHAEQLFLPTPAAGCTLKSTQLDSLVLEKDPKAKPAHEEEAGHADIDAEFVFQCAQPEKLHDIEVRLFDAYPNLHQLDVAVATAKGQTAAKLSAQKRRVSW